jgi:hypothetical protein
MPTQIISTPYVLIQWPNYINQKKRTVNANRFRDFDELVEYIKRFDDEDTIEETVSELYGLYGKALESHYERKAKRGMV